MKLEKSQQVSFSHNRTQSSPISSFLGEERHGGTGGLRLITYLVLQVRREKGK